MSKELLSHGPILGEITESSVKVWFRSVLVDDNTFLVRLFNGTEEIDFQEVHTSRENDYTGLAFFEELQDDSIYEAKIYLVKELAASIKVRTRSKQIKTLRFVFGSCRYNHWCNKFKDDAKDGDKTYEEIHKLHKDSELDFALFLGDQIYADPTYSVGISQSFEDFSTTYQKAFKQEHFHKLLSEVPSYMILDDHEIRDNWSKDMFNSFSFFENREEIYKNGIKNYELWQHSRNPQTGEGQYWYDFKQSGVPFFILDIRTQRLKNPHMSHRKTMLGDKQLGDLLQWLHSTKGSPVRFIGSGVPFFPDHVKKEDKWCEFEDERSMILEFIRIEKIGKTVFLSGDVHIGMVSKMTCIQDDSFNVLNLVSSPLYWPYRGMYINEFHGNKTVAYDQWTDKKRMYRGLFDYEYSTSNWVRENQFAEVEVNEDGSGQVRHFNMKENSFGDSFQF
ncbi:MAG: alkaline phosphatase family protein [Lentisphaeraceae bacterium]|nr:alkaline phosphatase family protein [Lentisphaeraceae bacterium]